MRDYSRAFDEEDAAEESNVSAELIALRKRLVEEWNAWRLRCVEDARAVGAPAKATAGVQEVPEAEREVVDIWTEEVIEQIEEVVED